MIPIQTLFSLLEENYVFLLSCDAEEKILYFSKDLKKTLGLPQNFMIQTKLEDILAPSSLISFRQAMENLEADSRGVHALLTSKRTRSTSLPMHVRLIEAEGAHQYVFFGAQIDTLNKISDWEREERVKELSALYGVAEWIENSPSIDEFFNKLPKYLSPGMRFPDEVVVYSIYADKTYGQKPAGGEYIVTFLMVSGALKGEIRIGYLDDRHKLLPEEQKMLSEIGRILSLALERRELAEGVALKEDEAAEFQRKLAQLDKKISRREGELEAQQQKLSTVDSYLDRITSSWDQTSRRMETMFHAIPEPVLLVNLEFEIVMSNQEEAAPGQKCYQAIFEREDPCPDCSLARVAKSKTPITTSIRHHDKHMQLHTLPVFNDEHEVEGIMEFIRDVTLEKTYEQQLQQADKLASLGQLVSGIGHEINNPNQFIRGNVKIVRQALTDMIPIVDAHYTENPGLKVAKLPYAFFKDHIMTLVDDMAHGSERIKGIVDGLRSFARKDEGLLVDVMDINTLLGTTTRLVQNQVNKRANIELDLDDNVPSFTGNSQKIEQVLINLMVNAAQAMPDDVRGTVKVSTTCENGMVVIKVADDGKGMDQKTLKQIFDPFFTTKRTKGGTGLGLAICFRIIEEHGGNISVVSELNKGTTFTVKLPGCARGTGQAGPDGEES
jgi:signal transduction histidine kinase